MTGPKPSPPRWFTLAAVASLLWGLAGAYACYSQLSLTPAQLAVMPAAQRDAFTAMPVFARAAYVAATAGGLAGAVLLLLRRRQAAAAFVLSLAGVVVQFGWVFLVFGGVQRLGPSALAFPGFILSASVAEIWLCGLAARRGWLT